MVEGNKIIQELLDSEIKIKEIFSVEPSIFNFEGEITKVSHQELKKISFLQHPKDSIALCKIPELKDNSEAKIQLILDGIQDPGNMGTIIRLADWFGIRQIICSEDTVDFYNPKVLQASMGSFLRVNIMYRSLDEFLSVTKNPNIGTDMNGKSIYQADFPENFNLILGNEGNGIRKETEKFLQETVSIPRFGDLQSTESLNVSVATAIILGQIFAKNH